MSEHLNPFGVLTASPEKVILGIFIITIGIIMLLRVTVEPTRPKPYLTRWKAFYIGDICLAMFAGNSLIMVRPRIAEVLSAWYTEKSVWVVAFAVAMAVSFALEYREHKSGNRDPRILTVASQLFHTLITFPVVGALCAVLFIADVSLRTSTMGVINCMAWLIMYIFLVLVVDAKTDHSNQTLENR